MIKENFEKIKKRIEDIKGVPYDEAGVTVVAVSKYHPASVIAEAREAGVTDIGENRVQELIPRLEEAIEEGMDDLNFHMVGHLQSNKVRDLVGKVKLIHSVDRKSLLRQLERRSKNAGVIQEVLVQVNVAEEETRSGLLVDEVFDFLEKADSYKHFKVVGLMTMAPYCDDPEDTRWIFEKMKTLFDEAAEMDYNNTEMKYLSMGMSNDFEIALECGSNMIRLGTSIFGEREY